MVLTFKNLFVINKVLISCIKDGRTLYSVTMLLTNQDESRNKDAVNYTIQCLVYVRIRLTLMVTVAFSNPVIF